MARGRKGQLVLTGKGAFTSTACQVSVNGLKGVTTGLEGVTAGLEGVTAGLEGVTAGLEGVTAGLEDVTAGLEDVTAEKLMHNIDIYCCLGLRAHDNVKEEDLLHGVMLQALDVPKALPSNEGRKLLTLVLPGSPQASAWPALGQAQGGVLQ